MMVMMDNSELRAVQMRIRRDHIIRTACLDSIALITNRIQNKGKNSSNGQIGEYSPKYAEYRAKNGRQTTFVDLTFTGEMVNGLVLDKTSESEYVVGFASKAAGDKADWNEARFGEVFALTKEEIELVGRAVENNLDAAIRG